MLDSSLTVPHVHRLKDAMRRAASAQIVAAASAETTAPQSIELPSLSAGGMNRCLFVSQSAVDHDELRFHCCDRLNLKNCV
jgi:hypothetical protein